MRANRGSFPVRQPRVDVGGEGIFVRAIVGVRGICAGNMEEELRAAWIAARAAWPGVFVSEEDFIAFARARSSAKSDPEHAGSEPRADLRAPDLYLACACARGDGAAIAAFERTYFRDVDQVIKKSGGPKVPPIDEVRQLVRHKMFVAEPGSQPKIAEYSGRGDLRSWFRVAVTRMVLNLSTRGGREVPFEEDLLGLMLGHADAPEYSKGAFQDEFRAAFGQAFAALSDRDRSLLRYAFGEELTVDAIGALHGVHRATAARWVVRAHRTLLEGVRSVIMARLGLREDEYASVLRDIYSRLDLSLERYLRPPAD